MLINVLTQAALDRLADNAESDFPKYAAGQSQVLITAADVLPCSVKAADDVPSLRADTSDFENARMLWTWLAPAGSRQARDNRLWTWLAVTLFREYVSKRWPPKADASPANWVRSRWLLRGDGRNAVSRHALARLWWAADATYHPSRIEPGLKLAESAEGEWWFTEQLLLNQDAFQALRERKFGGNRVVLCAALKALSKFKSIGKPARFLGLQLNLIGKHRVLETMQYDGLVSLCTDILGKYPAK